MFSQARKSKAKINKQHYIKPRSFCTVKKTISKMKRLPIETEKLFSNNISDKALLFKIYKKLIQLNNDKTQPPDRIGRHFSKEDW